MGEKRDRLRNFLVATNNLYASIENNFTTLEAKLKQLQFTKYDVKAHTFFIPSMKQMKYLQEFPIKSGRYQISDEPVFPKWDDTIYDNDFPFDPELVPTQEDYDNWKQWELYNFAASLPSSLRHAADFLGLVPDNFRNSLDEDLSDATRAYNHFRKGEGKDLVIDLQKGFQEDVGVRKNVLSEIRDMQYAVEELRGSSGLSEFNVSGRLLWGEHYPETENWQKTLGSFCTWSYAQVSYENGEYHMTITVNSLDRYNFNSD